MIVKYQEFWKSTNSCVTKNITNLYKIPQWISKFYGKLVIERADEFSNLQEEFNSSSNNIQLEFIHKETSWSLM